MLLHNQKSMYHMDDVEKTNLTDMVSSINRKY